VTIAAHQIFTLADLLDAVPGAMLAAPDGPVDRGLQQAGRGDPGQGVFHLACHTSEIVPGASMFAAIRGGGAWYVGGDKGFDFHQYVPKAIDSGAAALLVEEIGAVPPGTKIPVIVVPEVIEALCKLTTHLLARHGVETTAVTGSTGKTSTCEIVAQVLSRRDKTFKFISNRATPVSVPRNVLNAGVAGIKQLVMEMPMDGAGQITALCGITPPKTGIVVNINESHIVQLGSIENITNAKAELVEALPANGTAVLNFDDPRVRQFDKRTRAQVIGVGTSADCTLRADTISLDTRGVSFVLHQGGSAASVRFAMPTRLAVINALLGAGAGIAAGMSLDEVVPGLKSFQTLPGRMKRLTGRGGFALLDNSLFAMPQTTELILGQVLEIPCKGRHLLAQGLIWGGFQHGDVPDAVYSLIERFDDVYLTSSETLDTAEAMSRRGSKAHWYETPEETANAILEMVGPDDLVLVNGNIGAEVIVGHLVQPGEDKDLVDDTIRATM
jgi:UDP-N-acetylmuramyl pentapeptide synthase